MSGEDGILYDTSGNKLKSDMVKSGAQTLIDTMQQGMLYMAFSYLVVKRLNGKESAEKYMEKVYKKLTHFFPEYFLMLRKIENTEWEDIYKTWMNLK